MPIWAWLGLGGLAAWALWPKTAQAATPAGQYGLTPQQQAQQALNPNLGGLAPGFQGQATGLNPYMAPTSADWPTWVDPATGQGGFSTDPNWNPNIPSTGPGYTTTAGWYG